MSRYPAFVDGEAGAYGVTFPDLPGIVAMGETMDDALVHAEEALRDYVTETERDGAQVVEASPAENVTPPEGSVLVAIPLVRLEQQVLQLLRKKIRLGSSECEEPKVHFPDLAVCNGTEQSLRTLLFVHRGIELIRTADVSVRTRAIRHTSTDAVGLAWQEATGRRREIQAVLLPTKSAWQGCIEAFLRGHDETPVSAPTKVNKPHCIGGDLQLIDGKPNFHIIAEPSPELIDQLVKAYEKSSLS